MRLYNLFTNFDKSFYTVFTFGIFGFFINNFNLFKKCPNQQNSNYNINKIEKIFEEILEEKNSSTNNILIDSNFIQMNVYLENYLIFLFDENNKFFSIKKIMTNISGIGFIIFLIYKIYSCENIFSCKNEEIENLLELFIKNINSAIGKIYNF